MVHSEISAKYSRVRTMLQVKPYSLSYQETVRAMVTPSTVYQRFRDWRNRGAFDQMLKRLHIKLNEQGLIDLETWMIDSTAVRATRASSGAGKKGGLKNRKTTRSGAAGAA